MGIIISIDSPPLDCFVDFGPFYLSYSRSVSWPGQKNDFEKEKTFFLIKSLVFLSGLGLIIVLSCLSPTQSLSHVVAKPNKATGQQTFCQDRRFVRKTFCQHVFCETFCQEDILSVQFFCGRILHRRFVRKTNCQHFDHISGMLTLFMVCLRYIWYFDHISGMLTLFLVCSPLYLVCWRYFWYVYLMSGILTIFPAYILKARIVG